MTTQPGFLTALEPLIERAQGLLLAELAATPRRSAAPALPDAPALVEMLFPGVRRSLESIITPTLALELNVARLRGELAGETAEARYDDYIEMLARDDYREALQTEYPALFELAAARLDTWVATSLELLARLDADWPHIVATFFAAAPPGALQSVRFTQGSTKRGGRSVVALAFESGARLVYKPRSQAVELRFQELLAWLNAAGFEPEFRPPRILDRGTHGWMEWIEAADSETVAGLRRFYRRQGANLALFYALEATDIHMSNVVAAGEHPVLIDLEALFHPRAPALDWPALELALDDMAHYSVLRPGLLPEPEGGEDEELPPVDTSGLAGAGGQITPYTVPRWQDRGTDRMRLEQERKIIHGSKNLPTLGGNPVDAGAFLHDLEQGFVDVYELLMAHKEELLAPGGLLELFAPVEVRVLPRSGRGYGEILRSSYHPDMFRDPDARPNYLSLRLRPGEDEEAGLARLAPRELAALLAGDIPIFLTRPDSHDLVDGLGAAIPEFSPVPGLRRARERIAALDAADLERQRWFIRASFATVAPQTAAERRPLAPPVSAPANLRERALAAAVAIGERLAGAAVRADGMASWLGLEPDEGDYWFIEPLGVDLAHGLPGVILFLDALAAQTGEARWSDLAAAAFEALRHYLAESRAEREAAGLDDEFDEDAYDEFDDEFDEDEFDEFEDDEVDYDDDEYDSDEFDEDDEIIDDAPIGLTFGLGGTLLALARLVERGAYPAAAEELDLLVAQTAARLRNAYEDDDADFAGLAYGLAGCLVGLLAAQRARPAATTAAAARLAGEMLMEAINVPDDEPDEGPFASFYDSLLGAIGPLLALAGQSGNGRYRAAALEVLDRLAAGDAADAGLWRAYLFARPWLDAQARLDEALRAALPAIVREGTGYTHAMGDGDLAYVDLLLLAAGALDDDSLRDEARRWAAAVLDDIDARGPRTAAPLQVESPGYATGLAGIGYGLLRVAAPAAVAPVPDLPGGKA